MDPNRIYKPKGVAADTPSVSSPYEPFIRENDETTPADGCIYSTQFRERCVNGRCQQERKRLRQCPGRLKEQAIIDPNTKQEKWIPASEEGDVMDFFSSPITVQGAIGDLFQEIQPEFDRINQHYRNDPFFGEFFRNILPPLALPRGSLMPSPLVPFHRHPLPPSQTSPPSNGRTIPIQDQSDATSPPSRPTPPTPTAASNHSRVGSSDDDAILTNPITNIAERVQSFANKMTSLFRSSSSKSASASPASTRSASPADSQSTHDRDS